MARTFDFVELAGEGFAEFVLKFVVCLGMKCCRWRDYSNSSDKPIFGDVLSPESRHLEDPLWLAYGQFERTFLLALAARKHLGWPLASSLIRRDGYSTRDLYPHFSGLRRYLPPLFSLVTVPYLLERKWNSPITRKPKPRYRSNRLLGSLLANPNVAALGGVDA